MKQIINALSFFVLFFFLSINVQANNKSPIVRDGNIDAGARIMKIYCPSGDRTTVRLYIEDFNEYLNGQTCVHKKDGSSICKSDWDLDEAAVTACDQLL